MRKSMRSRMGIGAAALVGLCLTALSAAAQQERNVTTSKGNGDTVKVTVSGNVVLDYVYRAREMTAYTDSFSGAGVGARSENTFEGYVAARLDVDLSDKVSAQIEFGTKRLDTGTINNWGNAGANAIQLREAAVVLNDFFLSDLKAHIGITNWSFDVRGKGSAFAFDPRHSQTLNRNLAALGGIATIESGDTRLGLASAVEELESVGAVFTYTRNNLTFDLVLLPAAIEGGPISTATGDEALYAIDGWYKIDDKGSKAGLIIAHSRLPGALGGESHAAITTIGGGVSLKGLGEGVELYIEGYFQSGKAGEDATGDDIRANGRAVQLGGEYHLQSENQIWFGANFTWMSGDDDTDPTDDQAGRFVSYENIHDLMILEDQNFGFDWDSNLQMIKLMAGMSFSVAGGKNNLEVGLMGGFGRTAKEVGFSVGTETSRKLGNEIDAKVRWHLNKQASISFGLAYLFSSSILEESMIADGFPSSDAEETTYLYTLGVDLRF